MSWAGRVNLALSDLCLTQIPCIPWISFLQHSCTFTQLEKQWFINKSKKSKKTMKRQLFFHIESDTLNVFVHSYLISHSACSFVAWMGHLIGRLFLSMYESTEKWGNQVILNGHLCCHGSILPFASLLISGFNMCISWIVLMKCFTL